MVNPPIALVVPKARKGEVSAAGTPGSSGRKAKLRPHNAPSRVYDSSPERLNMNALLLRRARLASAQSTGAPAPADPSAAAITETKLWRLREPNSRRLYSVVRIKTRGGLSGYGECAHVGSEELVRGAQIIQGKAATSYEVLDRQLAATPALQPGVNMALLDILGKIAKAPTYHRPLLRYNQILV